MKVKPEIICPFCKVETTFTKRKSLYRHLKNFHQDIVSSRGYYARHEQE